MKAAIPESWRMAKLGQCLQRRLDTVMPDSLSDESVGLVGLEDIEDGGRGGIAIRRTPPREIESLKTRFVAGDILYGKLRPYLNKVGIVTASGLCSTEIWAFTTHPMVDVRFAAFFLASSFFVERVASLTKGANLPRLDTQAFDSLEIPVPPLSEQQRIVEILHEAGEIRRLRVQAEAKTVELIPAMFHAEFVLRDDYKYERLDTFAEVVSGVAIGRSLRGFSNEVPYLRVANVQAGYIDLTEVKTTPATDEEIEAFGLQNGDVLLTEGGDFDKLGRGCLWEGQVAPCIHQNHVFRVRPLAGKLNSHFFAHYLQSARAKQYFLRCAKRTTNLASINLTQLKALPVPVVSMDEQERFETSVSAGQECQAGASTVVFNRLVASLSAHAFSGQLTAEWREKHSETLATEARDRDRNLEKSGTALTRGRRATISELDEGFSQRIDGIYADLNREQRDLLFRIQQSVGGVDYGRYFTAEKLAANLDGALHRNPQAIEAHLTVFAVRGLILPISRPREEVAGRPFAACYRLPLPGPNFGTGWEPSDPATPSSDDTRSATLKRIRSVHNGGAVLG